MAGKKSGKVTPLMKQYNEMKAKHPDAILLFRVGDFYETFGSDAEHAAKALGITLTSRNNGGSDIALAGFPYHSLEVYLPKLIRAGFRVALCEQLEKPSKERKVVRRGITELITPGVVHGDHLVDHKRNNFLAAVAPDLSGRFGIAFVDITTGDFFVAQGNESYIDKLLQGFAPAEVVLPKGYQKKWTSTYSQTYYAYPLEDWIFEESYAKGKLIEQFQVKSLKGFGIDEERLPQIAAGAILHYLAQTQNTRLSHLTGLRRLLPGNYVWLDRFTVRNLELIEPSHPDGKALVDVLDGTVTPMGARLLRRWIVLPLTNIDSISKRLNAVTALKDDETLTEEIEQNLKQIGDLERLCGKLATQRINPREFRQLHKALAEIPKLKSALSSKTTEAFNSYSTALDDCTDFAKRIDDTLQAEVPVQLAKGDVIAAGVDQELDAWRSDVDNAQTLLKEVRDREAEATGITSLKIGFNNVFGYYLEVSNKYKNQGLTPDSWIRKQTLTNAERYISEELKTLEARILGANDKIADREAELYANLVGDALKYVSRVQASAKTVASLDCIHGFAKLSRKQGWNRPILNEATSLKLKSSRHPVIEVQLPPGESYVPNDINLDRESDQILMITGPNMSGKSAILRQTALAVIMAQIGCYVAADQAEIGLVDKVFTRVGASDNLSSGESTFMVEMNETASIMNNVSARSLILLDEIGRGTSTFDGVSIAWSIAEYLHDHGDERPKTLFATHYHELNALSTRLTRIKNMHVSTQEAGDKVIFLRKLTAGGSRHSFGIHVARMAGMPTSIVVRAGEILRQLEQQRIEQGIGEEESMGPESTHMSTQTITRPMQLSIFEAGDPIAAKLRAAVEDLDIDNLTPIEAMMKVLEWRGMIK